jgi:HlyD family secretion protein
VEPGDTVQPGVLLLEMAAAGITELVIDPDERNLAWIRIGQVARASADAWPDDVFEATVSYIAPSVDARRGSVEVRLEVPDPPPYLRPDMTVSVDLTVGSKSGVVAVPSDAIRGPASGAQFVWVVRDGRVEQRVVTLGIRGDGHTEITSGLDPDTDVVLTTDRVLDDGQRVRVSRPDR